MLFVSTAPSGDYGGLQSVLAAAIRYTPGDMIPHKHVHVEIVYGE